MKSHGRKSSLRLSRPHVVGTVASYRSLDRARALPGGAVDLLELRVDAFAAKPDRLLNAIPDLPFPLLITVRHALEGGLNALTLAQRRELFEQFLPHASALDIELRSVESMATLAARARSKGVALVLSYHNFQTTPSITRLHELGRRALLGGADVLKLATCTDTIAQIATLLFFFAQQKRLNLAVMGMGHFGRACRLLLAQAGSVLNYGYLDRPHAPGQWPALELKQRIAELSEGGNDS